MVVLSDRAHILMIYAMAGCHRRANPFEFNVREWVRLKILLLKIGPLVRV